jgi:hypothetical protein
MSEVKRFEWKVGDVDKGVDVAPGTVFSTMANQVCTGYATTDGGKVYYCPVSASRMKMDAAGDVVTIEAGRSPKNGKVLRFESFADGIATFVDLVADEAWSMVYNEVTEV